MGSLCSIQLKEGDRKNRYLAEAPVQTKSTARSNKNDGKFLKENTTFISDGRSLRKQISTEAGTPTVTTPFEDNGRGGARRLRGGGNHNGDVDKQKIMEQIRLWEETYLNKQ